MPAEKTPARVDPAVRRYMAGLAPAQRKSLEKLQAVILSEAAGAELKLSYGMPSVRAGGRLLVYFAAFAEHCSLFVGSVAVLEAFKEELGERRTSRGTIQFTAAKPLPAALVRRLVRARLAENPSKAKGRPVPGKPAPRG